MERGFGTIPYRGGRSLRRFIRIFYFTMRLFKFNLPQEDVGVEAVEVEAPNIGSAMTKLSKLRKGEHIGKCILACWHEGLINGGVITMNEMIDRIVPPVKKKDPQPIAIEMDFSVDVDRQCNNLKQIKNQHT